MSIRPEDHETENSLPPASQAAIQRMKRWVSEPGTTLLKSDALPGAPAVEPPAPVPVPTPPPAAPSRRAAESPPTVKAVPEPVGFIAPELASGPLRQQARLYEVAMRLAERIVPELQSMRESKSGPLRTPERRQLVRHRAQSFLAEMGELAQRVQGPEEANVLLEMVEAEVLGYGPLEPLLADDSITEIMVVGPSMVFVERSGKVGEIEVRFQDEAHLMRIIRNILQPLGRTVSRSWPMADGRLPDGSRVNVVVAPSAVNGPSLTIRKFSRAPMLMEDLIGLGTLSPPMAALLYGCVLARLNIVISGGTGSGKTTLLNALSDFIPENERIVTIEDAAELQLNQRHVVSLEAKPAELDGSGRVTIRDLVTNALRMRPDRIVVGECRGGEALDMLQAMNTGHDGSLTTAHANGPRDCLTRLETMALMSGMDLPLLVVRRQIANAVQVVVHQSRMRDGSRKVTHIAEVQGIDDQTIVMQDLFRFKQTGADQTTGKVQGVFEPGGFKPRFYHKLEMVGVRLPDAFFVPEERRRGLGWGDSSQH